jgi:hypothetical protein
MLTAWLLSIIFQDRFISDWDGFDYTAYAITNVPSALGLGRALFLAYNHVLWLAAHWLFGVPPERAYLVIRYGVMVQSGPAVAGFYFLYKELTESKLAAICGSLLIALSPLFIVYSGRAMSEIPAFLMLGWSLWWMIRSLKSGGTLGFYLSALLFGLSANMREFAIFYLPAIPLLARHFGRTWISGLLGLAVACVSALSGAIFWSLYRPDYYISSVINWYRLSSQEAKVHPVTIRNVAFLASYAWACSPIASVVGPFTLKPLARILSLRPLLIIGALGLLADLVLLANWDLPVNPRYPLTGLAGLAGLAGWGISELVARRPRWRTVVLVVFAVVSLTGIAGAWKFVRDQDPAAIAAKNYYEKIASFPGNSVFIVGARTPLVNFYQSVRARPDWKTVSSGAGWPDERLSGVIDGYISEGRPVYVDFDPKLWVVGMREHSREAAGLDMIRQRYKLEVVQDSLYRITL